MNEIIPIGMVCVGSILLIAVLFLVAERQKQNRIARAEENYQSALADLRRSPNDTTLREEALRLGRVYADVARKDKRTMFDEVALMNDLNAIQPTVNPKNVEADKSPKTADSTEERLTKLEQLRTKGLITDAEYKERRSAILDEI